VLLRRQFILAVELDRLVRRAIDPDLPALDQTVAKIEADDGAAVESKEIAGQIAEITSAERAAKAMGQSKRELVHRHSQVGGQRREREIRLCGIRIQIGIVLILCGGGPAA